MRRREDEEGRIRIRRTAAPAPAREIIRANAESLAVTDATSSAAAAPVLSPRLAELRARVQEGSYQVDLKALSHKIVQDHLDGREP